MAKIAFVLDQDFEDSEFQRPYDELKKAGHDVTVVGTEAGKELRGKRGESTTKTDASTNGLSADDYDMLVIPGGYSPDKLRMNADIVHFVRDFMESGKPVGAICHAAQLLIEADTLGGRTLTSWPSVRTDVFNAGGKWVDRELVEDGNLITSRKPDDLKAFCGALLKKAM